MSRAFYIYQYRNDKDVKNMAGGMFSVKGNNKSKRYDVKKFYNLYIRRINYMFDYTVATDKTMNQAIESLEESLKEEKFGVLWMFDIKEKLQEKGLEFSKEFKVLEVCNPVEAKRILSENEMAGYFLPCKLVVFEDNGKNKIGMPRPTALISLLNDEKMKTFAKDIEDRLINVINKSI